TLFAFAAVAAGVIVLRRTQPERSRAFRVPGAPWVPALSILFCLILMLSLPLQTWLRFLGWMAAGAAVYWLFGRKHSALAD
ncbi:MAG: amino acid permease C-terminal domain-containing protein, partial [Bryobacteraceae bacterium]